MRNPSSPTPIAISMGDPMGVGPEVILKALCSSAVDGKVAPIVVGIPSVMEEAATLLRTRVKIKSVSPDSLDELCCAARTGTLCVLSPELAGVGSGRFGPKSMSELKLRGMVASSCVRGAVTLCAQGRAAALVTGPVSKASFRAAGIAYAGHTEMLRDLCRCKDALMMFARGRLRISLVTTHIPIGTVKRALTKKAVTRAIALTQRSLSLLFGVRLPHLAVLSLNPHKGEDGLLGSEEKNVIEPAIVLASKRGIQVCGPFSADSFFTRGRWKNFDAVVAMYHDQGLIPAKLLGGEGVTNITLGLPFVQNSPGHGVAEDIAWKGIAEPAGMISAILLAARLGRNVKSPLIWD